MNYEVEAPEPCKQHCIAIEDDETANLLDHLEDVLDFLDGAIDDSDGKVLVHCHNGVSRSPAVVLAFLCYSMGLQLNEAIEVLRMDVPRAAPNEGFMQQLQLFVAMGCELHAHDDELIERSCCKQVIRVSAACKLNLQMYALDKAVVISSVTGTSKRQHMRMKTLTRPAVQQVCL